ncbi:MAG: hypothetical protein JWN15_2133 [Firmicutes bacterium]|nr:hypothetical protein [Bacillota bacterium]
MLPFLLFLIGAALSVYCLWQLRRWLEQADGAAAAGSRRLGSLVDELVATAETTVSVVEEKAEALAAAIARADERLVRLEAAVAAPPVQALPAVAAVRALEVEPVHEPRPVAEAVPVPAQRELYSKVYALADAGHDVTGIARTLNIAKGEVQLILGIRPATREGA